MVICCKCYNESWTPFQRKTTEHMNYHKETNTNLMANHDELYQKQGKQKPELLSESE